MIIKKGQMLEILSDIQKTQIALALILEGDSGICLPENRWWRTLVLFKGPDGSKHQCVDLFTENEIKTWRLL